MILTYPTRSAWLYSAIARAGIIAIPLALISAETPAAALDECGDRPTPPLCVFDDAPVQVGPAHIHLPGHAHPYAQLLAPLQFTDPSGTVWTAPPAILTDGASIPPIFVPLIGAPRSREFLAAAALHDAYCGRANEGLAVFRARGWEETHRMFYDALRAAGVPPMRAKIMFAAVYLGGPRWDDPARSLQGVPESELRAEMARCIRFIEETDPSLSEIETWMREREAILLGVGSNVD
ncbi:DUF1353 domain-containing protein [Wenxinia marina]|uniref:DUF1353 domain-containing protein n=1 Tax=Wenxinia marina DSM 24838 TaxID=1123501 RepID=A0A0D0Q4G5_9RHOB|nr:DUF1353 domain-containing protein [Wenxinia marina]KIQ69429.1 hypothetical protein Wenmar_01791 [Wenxinia marina DSM 24838]GGL58273.1 hypothetical protein GCM10011392_10890 [Wenxinia marina]